MAYSDIALLANDYDFTQRVTACVATEGITSPSKWTIEHSWQMAASPGFGDKYAYAIQTGVERPGNDPSVISDAEILSAAQELIGSEPPAETLTVPSPPV